MSAAGTTITPTIFQRSIVTTVAVNDRETIALGGLISEDNRAARSGIPILMDLPLIGFMFGSITNTTDRTELIILLTPTVVRNAAETRSVTDEMRKRLRRVQQHLQQFDGLLHRSELEDQSLP